MTETPNLPASSISPGVMLAGYRIVRLLGRGSRATVWLGHAGPADAPRVAAIKVYRDGAARASIDAELHALSAAAHPHVVQLLDLSSSVVPAPCLILERLTSSSLASVVAEREVIPAGEAVTMVAPVVSAVVALHESGIAHGAISATKILFRETGAPVLVGFGTHDAVPSTDVEALVALVRMVLRRVRTTESGELEAWLDDQQLSRSTDIAGDLPSKVLMQLSERIFLLGVAQPIQFSGRGHAVPLSPARLITSSSVELLAADTAAVGGAKLGAHPVDASISSTAARLVESAIELLPFAARAPAARAIAATKAVRRPVWLAIGVAAVVFVTGAVTATSEADAPDNAPEHAGSESIAVPGGTAVLPSTDSYAAQGTTGSVNEDDPVAAFTALWALRRECVMQLSVLCLDDVDQNGSAALDDDAALIAAIENGSTDGSRVALNPVEIVLIERHGDAALIGYETSSAEPNPAEPNPAEPSPAEPSSAEPSSAEPTTTITSVQRGSATGDPKRTTASALLVKGEAGWRVRDYLGG